MAQAKDFYATVGKRVRRARESCHWSQEQLATAIGIEQATLSRYENGTYQITLEVLRRISTRLRVPLLDLIDVSAEGPIAKPFIPPPKPERDIRKGDEAEILRVWRGMPPKQRRSAIALLKTMRRVERKPMGNG